MHKLKLQGCRISQNYSFARVVLHHAMSHVLHIQCDGCVLTRSACLVYHTQMVMSSDAVTKRCAAY